MASDQHAKSFIADGPTERGFETGDGNINVGVFARGKKAGVWGIGVDPGNESINPLDSPAPGVIGQSKVGAGVQGISEAGDGVFGQSKSGPGISGFSAGDYGGQFRSGFAQLRLVPSDEAASGPPPSGNHQKSECFVDKDGSLFYCFAEGNPHEFDPQNNPVTPKWRELILTRKNTLGPPTTGKHTTGEFYVDRDSRLWFCVDDGTPGTWKEIRLYTRSPLSDLIDRLGAGLLRTLGISR